MQLILRVDAAFSFDGYRSHLIGTDLDWANAFEQIRILGVGFGTDALLPVMRHMLHVFRLHGLCSTLGA